jgi:hypothetical protein
MPVKYIVEQIQFPSWAGDRFKKLDIYQRFLDGKIYDHLQFPFYQEVEDGTQAYIPLRERRPSVIYNLCRLVVNRSSRLLFGGKHFPKFICPDKEAVEFIQRVKDKFNLQGAMLEAAYTGAIGSVGVFFSIIEENIAFEIINPRWCMPRFDKLCELEEVMIMYPVCGYDLYSCGYSIDEDDINEEFFFAKKLTKTEEIRFVPIKVDEYEKQSNLVIDKERSVVHDFGFVPGVWIKNLFPGEGVDGECTFSQILNSSVEIDYQLSQCGRGLKYNSDPQLMIKEPSGNSTLVTSPMGNADTPTIRSASNALFVGEEGDAKLLEISGAGQKAVLDYVKQVRQYALETVASSVKDAESSYGNTSGRAMEILEGDLVAFASVLRLTYGEKGLKPLVFKLLKAAKLKGWVNSDPTSDKDFDIELYWGNWFDPTPTDMSQTEIALDLAVKSKRLFMHEARMISAGMWDVGHSDPHKLEAQWPIPDDPDLPGLREEPESESESSDPKTENEKDPRARNSKVSG